MTGISATHRIMVAVIDTGIDPSHPDFINNFVAGYDFFVSNTAPQDQDGHVSMVVGVIGAEINNNICVAGIGGSDRKPMSEACG